MSTREDQIASLHRVIAYHRDLYYTQDTSEISDYEYDTLIRRLAELEGTPSAQVTDVGAAPIIDLDKVRHRRPLLSLANAYSDTELATFTHRVQQVDSQPLFSVEYKIDGLTVVLTYEQGHLIEAATRGNGIEGERVLENVKTIDGIPHTLRGDTIPSVVVVRGEVYIKKSRFEAINAEGGRQWANPRNMAAGSLRTKDASTTAKRGLSCWTYDIVYAEHQGQELRFVQHEMLAQMQAWGFPVEPHTTMATPETVASTASALWEAKDALDFEIDGIVVKANDYQIRDEMGFTGHDPKWAIARKFPAEQQATLLRDITIQVGRTGRLTPVGELEAVKIDGSTVSRVTLHNSDFITALDVRIGDTVMVQKAGAVIPELVSVVLDQRPATSVPYAFPTTCPMCQAPVVDDRCTGTACPSQIFTAMQHFAKPDVMDIEGMGPGVIEKLLDAGLLNDIGDFYSLQVADIASIPGLGERTATMLVQRIEASKVRGLGRVLLSLNIPLIGHHMTEKIAMLYPDMDTLLTAVDQPDAIAQFSSLDGVGTTIATALVEALRSQRIRDLIQKLRIAGVSLTSPTYAPPGTTIHGALSGQTFVITGTLTRPRNEAEQWIRDQGGALSGSVSKKTSYVVVGEKPGSKLQKAESLGVPILTEDQLYQLS